MPHVDRRSDEETASVRDRWIAGDSRLAPEAVVRLFCFAHAGGGAAFFFPWRRALAPEIDVRPVVLPGREGRVRETPYRRVEQLLDPMCSALEPYLDRPFALFGHSLGAVIAHEVTHRLGVRRSPQPFALVVSGRRAPRLASSRRPLSTLPDADFLRALGNLNGTPSEIMGQPQLLRAMLPTLRADFELNESYRPLADRPLSCPVAAYMGRSDPEVDSRELLAWHDETCADFTMRTFEGDHFYLKGSRPDVLGALRADVGLAHGDGFAAGRR